MSDRPEKQKRRRRTRVLRTGGLLVVLLATGAGTALAASRFLFSAPHIHASPAPTWFHHTSSPDRNTILLIGTDARRGDPLGNSDVLCVVSLDDKHNRIEFLSIPRDTQVAFPDGRYHKINDALLQGGPELTTRVVENLIGLPIDHYAAIRFDGLVSLIDRVGGVTINVPRRMYFVTGDRRYGTINLRKGNQHLNGEQALQFVRFRHDALGDIGRTERQQAFLEALKKQLLRPETIPQLPAMFVDMMQNTDTDMSLLDLGKLASRANTYAAYRSVHETLPGSFHDPQPDQPGDLSYWIVNPKQVRYVSKQLFDDGLTQTNPVQDPSITRDWHVPEEKPSSDANTENTPNRQ